MRRTLANSYSSILSLVIIQNIHGGSNSIRLEPEIQTKPGKLQLQRGETAEFHCRVLNLGDRHIVWRRGYDVLATERLVLSPDPRITVSTNLDLFSLFIKDIENKDKGEYVCQISTISGSSNLISVEHTLDILVPAQVLSTPETAYLTLKQGEDALLECKVSGNPKPTVTWTKQGSDRKMYGAECTGGSCVSLTNTQQGDAGAYTCTADNGVGAPHAANIFLTVQYPPQISSSQDKQVQQHQGEVRLECEVEGEPKPVVTWHKNTQQVFPSNTVKIKESGAKNYLVLLDASSSSSFGNYSCLAKNILGEAKKYIEVHGRPSSAVFSIMDSKPTRTHYYLVWDVKSPTPILEYRLLYRKIIKQGQMRGTYEGDDWTNVIIPGDQFNTGIQTQRMSWKLEKLSLDSDYECLVQARNNEGWSQPSTMFTFNTAVKSSPSAATQGYSWSLEGRTSSANVVFISQFYFFLLITSFICLSC